MNWTQMKVMGMERKVQLVYTDFVPNHKLFEDSASKKASRHTEVGSSSPTGRADT